MKKFSKFLTVCAVLALLLTCAVFSVSAEADVRTAFVCPCSDCVAKRTETPSYTCPEISAWKSVTADSKNTFADGGHYYVGTDTTSGQLVVSAGYEVVLMIDNAILRYEGTSRMISLVGNDNSVDSEMNLHIIGNNGGRLQMKSTKSSANTDGSIVQVGGYDAAQLHLYGDLTVSMEAGSTAAEDGGLIKIPTNGKVYVHDNASMGLTNEKDPALIGYNATGTSYGGGAIYIQGGSNATFDMAAGTISGSTVTKNGGAIYMANGKVNIYGSAQITGGSAAAGGAIYQEAGTLKIYGNAQITGGTTTGSGATIYSKGAVEIYGSAQLGGGTCDGSGGIIYQNAGSTKVYGNAQLTGIAANYGGVAYVNEGSSFEVSGNAQITGAAVKNYGGAFYTKGILDILGGTVIGGSATHGGAIGVNGADSKLTVSNATITGGTASALGGTIYMHTASPEVEIQDGAVITGGTDTSNPTATNGGTIYMAGGTLTMTGGAVSGGVAKNDGSTSTTGHGGCIYLAAGTATFQGGTVSGGQTVRAQNSEGKNQGGDGGTFYVATTLNLSGATVNGGNCYRGAAFFVTGSSGIVNMSAGTVNSGNATNQGDLAAVYSSGIFNMSGGVAHNDVLGDNSGIRVQNAKVYLHGDAQIEAGAGGRNAFEILSTGTTTTLLLAGNARVGDLEGKQTTAHNIILESYTYNGKTYYPYLAVANDWTGYATFTDNFGSTATGEYIMTVTSGDTTKDYARCGTWDAENLTFTKGGNYDGQYLIHGSADEGDVPVFGEDGKLMLPRAKAVVDGNTSWYRLTDSAADAVSNTNGYAMIYKEDTNPITLEAQQEAYVDFNGCQATVTGSGTLYGMDSSALTTGTGTSAVTFEGVTVKTLARNPVTGDSFIAIKEGNTATFHGITVNISSVSIRPGTVGMYYSAQFACDDTIKDLYLNNFGIAISLAGMPGTDFETDGKTLFTRTDGKELANGEFNSVLVQNIMDSNLDAATNKSRAEMFIYANAYMKLTVNGEEITVMAKTTSEFSLETLLQHVNTYWDTFTESAQTSLATKIYEPYIRDFGNDDWGIYNIRIKANGGYTAEEEAVLEERRQIVMDYMRQSVSLLWRSDTTLTYTLGSTQRDNGASFTIVEGRLYKGLPYVYAAGTQDSFLEYATGKPDENGIYTITGLAETALNYESYGGRVGNDCSGAVTNAWSQVSPSLSGSTSSQCAPYFGVVPVGNYAFNSPINPDTNRILDTKYVVESNGEQVMYEAYAMLQPADAAYHQEYPSTKGNHIRMVVSVKVVRNDDGTIDGDKSTITMLEQTRSLTNAGKSETHPETGETVYLIGGVDRTYKFSTLFGEHYIPVTVAELRDPSPVEDVWVKDTLEEATIDNLFTGSITTNYNFDAVRITIYDENGEIVQQTTGRKHRSYPKEYKMERFLTEKPGSMKGTLDLDALGSGNYRCTITVKLTTDDDYIHTVRDFTFSK